MTRSRHTARLAVLAMTAGLLVGTAGVETASAEDAVAGGLTSGDILYPNQGNSGYDALHYDVNISVNVAVSTTNNAVASTTFPAATTSIRAKSTGAPLSSYSFDFQGSSGNLAASTLNVDSVTVNGVPADFSRIENTTTSDATTDVHKLIVTPTSPVSGEFTTVVKYSGTPVRHTDTDNSFEGWNNTTDGATFVNQPVGSMTAFPNNNTPSDKATYTFTIEAPSKLTTSATAVSANPGLKDAAVVSNGELISRTPSADGSRTTWVWNQTKQMASELALISVGRYNMYESDITLASGRTLHEWSFIDPAISTQNQLTTQSTRAQLKSILDFLESRYGPYPGNSVGIVTDVVPSAINYALETQDRSFFPNSASRGTAIHEIMHQWFGDNVSPVVWNDIWLSEGPATYAETQVAHESAGSAANSIETSYYNAWNNSNGTAAVWTVPTAGMTEAKQLFGSQVYNRGSWTLEALRTAIGVSDFNDVMRQWQARYTGTSRTTADFIALAEEVSGRSLTAFFEPWLYGKTKAPWPAKFNLTFDGPTAPVLPGEPATYTLQSRNTGKVAQAGSAITVDLTNVLDKATLGTLPAGTVLDGNTLTWTVPTTAVGATSSVAFTVVPNAGTEGAPLKAIARSSTLGATCIDCSQALVVGAEPVFPAPAPSISGSPTVGMPVTAETEGWLDGTTFTYQWLLDGTPIKGATGATYTPDGFATGLRLSVKVTGSNGSLSPVTRTSAATALTAPATLTSSTPTISGTAQFGKMLTVDTGTWEPGTYFTYQWATNGTNVTAASGGTGPTFTPALATQLGQAITVTVTGTKFGYSSASKTSTATAGVAAGEFTSTPMPTFSGTPRALSPLTAVPGQWEDGTTLSYQWSVDGANVGSNSTTYTPTIAQIGSHVTVTVTATKPGFPTTVRTSDPSGPIAPAAQTLKPKPVITGTAQVGEPLNLEAGTWDADTELAYQWYVDGLPVDAATDLTFTPGAGAVGLPITASVTSTKTNYETVTTTSEPTASVAPADLTNTPVPTVTGTPQVGLTLTAVPGTWDDDTELAYQWYADGDAVDDATGPTYTPGPDQLGAAITVQVTGTKTGYASVTKTSDETDPVARGVLTSTPVPTITGTPQVGLTLTAVPGTWDDHTELAYQWYADGDAVDGATAPTYTPGPGQLGAAITVKVTGTKIGYDTVTKTSAETDPVARGDLTSTPVPTITGTAKVGRIVTAHPGGWDPGTDLRFQWTRNGLPITGATSPTYRVVGADFGRRLRVTVTGSRPGYATITRSSTARSVAAGTQTRRPKPAITGKPKVGRTLTARARYDTGVSLSYRWLANGRKVGRNAKTLKVTKSMLGQRISVRVTARKTGYVTLVRTSARTAKVVNARRSLRSHAWTTSTRWNSESLV